jgi:hypothetical protein
MDCLTFIAAIVGSLVKIAWPAAVFGSVWIFRDKIQGLLPLLRLKYKDFDVSFRFDEAEKEAAKLPAIENQAAPPTPEETSRFERTADVSPRAAILEARTEIEAFLRDTLEDTPLATSTSSSRPLGFTQMVRILRNNNIIDHSTSALLDDLRVIGNKAAHDTAAVFTKDDALKFRDLAGKATNQLAATIRLQLQVLS